METVNNRTITKTLSILGTALCLGIAITACGGSSETETIATPSPSPTLANSLTRETSTNGEMALLKPFEDASITILTSNAPQIAELLQRRAVEFEALTGATVNLVTVPFSNLYRDSLASFTEKANRYDAIIIPSQWLADYARANYIEDLTDRVEADPDIQWNDIAPFFRNFNATYDGTIYAVPLDGDFQMVYYRQDLLENAKLSPPQTWDDYLAIAEQFHGRDLNGDDTPDYGSCIAKKPNDKAYWMFWAIASPFLQTRGTEQGAFFDRETMEPLVNNEAFGKALDIFQKTTEYAPANELKLDLEATRSLFLSGRCALTLDWSDLGTEAISPATSQVIDRVGAVSSPGTRQVLDRETGQLVNCNLLTCSHAIGGINYAPYAAFGGWLGAIDAGTDTLAKDAGYAFLSYLSQPAQSNIDVTSSDSDFNPYRISQFVSRQPWLDASMSFETVSQYLRAIGVSLRSPNMVSDLQIPQRDRYQKVVLDAALADFLAGNITKDEAMQRIYNGWEALTEEIGRESQGTAYRSSLETQSAENGESGTGN